MAKCDRDPDQTISWGDPPRRRGEPGTSAAESPAEDWVPLSGEILELAREFVIARHASEDNARQRLAYTSGLWTVYFRRRDKSPLGESACVSPADVAALNALAHLAAALGETPSEVRYARAAAAVALAGELALEEGV